MEHIPVEILAVVLTHYGLDELIELRLVSRDFRDVIDDPTFYTNLSVCSELNDMFRTAVKWNPAPRSGFPAYCMWFRKYVEMRTTWLFRDVSNKEIEKSKIKLTNLVSGVGMNLSLGELVEELQIPIICGSPMYYFRLIRCLIIGFDIHNVVIQTHGGSVKEAEVWKNIYGSMTLYIKQHFTINTEVAELMAQFKLAFCNGSEYLKRYMNL